MTNKPNLYLPFPMAVHTGAIDLAALNPHVPQTAALQVANGQIPTERGSVELPDGQLAAYDFVALSHDADEISANLTVAPLSTACVDKQSRYVQSHSAGFVVLSTEATIQPVAELQPWRWAQWRTGFSRIGDVGIRHLGINAPTYDLTSVDHTAIEASSRKRYF